ncbi:hypothetical protein THIX_60462 [Thiomonas sp. X19]|uniref:hypothetical protein n=1 Tax=Thiomonas sp. X19 TaxID=1050370 RepID=UPI000B65283F|nr:hypothetical protein [Thiomonas sp. X19]SCC94404.1 hypothetical protein THIX_60462 [Thiomonas sp. X19]
MLNHITKKPFSSRKQYYLALLLRILFIASAPAIMVSHPLYLLVLFGGIFSVFQGWISWPVYQPVQPSIHVNQVQKPW